MKELPGPQGTVSRSSVANLAPYELEVGSAREGVWLLARYCTPTESIRVSGVHVWDCVGGKEG